MRFLLTSLAVIGFAWQAQAGTVVFQAAQDATLIESQDGLLANGAGPVFFVGRTGQRSASVRRSLLRFDLAGALPGGAQVTAAWLELALTPSNPQPVEVGLHRLSAPWGEGGAAASGGGGAPAALGDSTWLHRFYNADVWAAPGGDFASEASAVSVVADAGSHVWASTPLLVADVQRWLDLPASNHGWILIGGEEAPSTAKRFASRESADATAGPRLLVEFELACEAAGLQRGAFGVCNAYCEAVDCDGENPHGSPRACERLADRFARFGTGMELPCEFPDWDDDGLHDGVDNCVEHPNPGQEDIDFDGVGDVCDNCPADSNPGQEDGFGTVGMGDVCDCECFTALDVAVLIAGLQDPSVYSDVACVDTRPTKPLTAVVSLRHDGVRCGAESQDCSAIAVTFTEDNVCQFNPAAPAEPVERQGISDSQRETCREYILEAVEGAGLTCN